MARIPVVDGAERRLERSRVWLLFLLFLGVNLAIYANVLGSYFLSDDFRRIGRVVERGVSSDWQRFLRPVVVLSFVADGKLWHLDPLGYHLTNLLFHTVNGLLVVYVSVSLLRTVPMRERELWLISSLAGLLFIVLPSHTESVSWISGRTDLLATCFMLGSLVAYGAYCRTGQRRGLLIGLASFFVALLSKESAVPLPLVILLWTIPFALRRDLKERILALVRGPLLFFGVLAVYALLRYAFLGALIGGHGTEAHVGFDASRILYRASSMALRTFLPPLSEGFAHVVTTNAYLSLPRLAALVLVGALSMFALRRLRTVPSLRASAPARRMLVLIAILIASFWVTSPLLGNLEVSLVDTQGERFLYTPSVFATIAAVYALSLVGRVWMLAVPLILLLTLLSAAHTRRVNENWRAAGDLSRAVIQDIAAHARQPRVLLANVPDNYNGAYVLRNGLEEAVRIFGRAGHVKSAKALSFHDVRSPEDGVGVSQEAGKARAYEVRLLDEKAEFLRIVDDELAVTRDRSRKGFSFDLRESRDGIDLMFYSAGKIEDLPNRE